MRVLLAPALAVAAVAVVSAQQPVFRSESRVVPILATVQDADGRLVPNLESEHFTVFDNGKQQTISVFENTVQPFTGVVMLDFSGSMTANLKLLKQGTEQFLLRMLPEDKAQVGAFSDKIMFSGRFISDFIQSRIGGWNIEHRYFGTWERLTSSADEQVIDETAY